MFKNANKFFEFIDGKKIALCGIGRSNLPLIKLFLKYGAEVTACDRRSFEELGEYAVLAQHLGAQLSLGEKYLDNLDVDIIFRTPGMRFYLPQLVALKEKGVVVTSEMEIFFDICPCKIIAVTGSDGKTTTTTIISQLLKASNKTVHLGGNIGKPLLPEIETIKKDDYAVLELSSFQLISMRKSPQTAVITNIAPNHLDIHKDMEEYVNSKRNVLLHQSAFDKAVINRDNEITYSLKEDIRGERVEFSTTSRVYNGVYLENGAIYYSNYGKVQKVLDIADIKIPGMHNVQNYMAAIGAVWGEVTSDVIVSVAKSFGGVAHRAEFVREVNGVKYYNDSIASSPTRTACGTLSLYDFRIVLIAGGYDKHLDYTELGEIICKKVKTLILMGDTAQKIYNAIIGSSDYKPENIEIIFVNDMEHAVKTAYEKSKVGDIVSMSPASASFDKYKNFEERGEHFKKLVNEL